MGERKRGHPGLFLDILVAQSLIRVGQVGFIGVQQFRSISPCVEGSLQNLAAVIRIKSARVQGELIFQVSLHNTKTRRSRPVGPVSDTDRHDAPWLVDQLFHASQQWSTMSLKNSKTRFESQFADEPSYVLLRVQFRAFRRQRDQGDVGETMSPPTDASGPDRRAARRACPARSGWRFRPGAGSSPRCRIWA